MAGHFSGPLNIYKERKPQKLTIRFEHEYGCEEVSYERQDIMSDDLFWHWFMEAWPCIGMEFVKKELEGD